MKVWKVLVRSCANVQRKALKGVKLRKQSPRNDRVYADAIMKCRRIAKGVRINGFEGPNQKNVESVGI